MRVIRSAGQNVSPSDDGRLFDQAFTDGLFEDTTITHLGTNNVALGAMYGIICGRDFTAEAQTVAVELPEDDAGTTGYIYVEIDTSSDDVITIGSALAPFTPTYEDLNTNGAVAQMIIAEYVASSVAVTSLTATYPMASAGSVLPGSVATVEAATAVSNHAVGEFILWDGQMYIVTAAISVGEALVPGTNITATSAGAELSALKNGLITVDYSSPVPIVSSDSQSGSFVAPRNGTAFCNLQVTATNNYINVNAENQLVATWNLVGGVVFAIPLLKGQTLTWTSSSASAYMRAGGRSQFM